MVYIMYHNHPGQFTKSIQKFFLWLYCKFIFKYYPAIEIFKKILDIFIRSIYYCFQKSSLYLVADLNKETET